MIALLSLASTIWMFWVSYRRARREGTWSWTQVLLLIGATGVFFAGFMLPVIDSDWMVTRPGLFFSVLFGGILLFVAAVVAVVIKQNNRKLEIGREANDAWTGHRREGRD